MINDNYELIIELTTSLGDACLRLEESEKAYGELSAKHISIVSELNEIQTKLEAALEKLHQYGDAYGKADFNDYGYRYID